MSVSIRILFATALLTASTAVWGQSNVRTPQIGYLYPAGGGQGTVVTVTAGGQFLRGATDVYVTGKGVKARVLKYMRPLRNLNGDQRRLLQQRLKEIAARRLAELRGNRPPPRPKATDRAPRAVEKPDRKKAGKKRSEERRKARQRNAKGKAKASNRPDDKKGARDKKQAGDKKKDRDRKGKKDKKDKKTDAKPRPVTLPDHPLFWNLENQSLRQLAHLVTTFRSTRGKRQLNRQLAEWVMIEVQIEQGAPPGARELRIATLGGLTNPMVFQVGEFPEVQELEPNDRQADPVLANLPGLPDLRRLPPPKPITLPVVLNGQILPGDVDRFRFQARKGQQLVIEAHARSLIPYLADAVPGWFQATLTLYDARGQEVAFVDDFRFHPDPVLFYKIPTDGDYELEIRDAIYRGREDFVYRIVVGEQPFITHVFPLGGQAGIKTTASIRGWNLQRTHLPLDTEPGGGSLRTTQCRGRRGLSNAVVYAVDPWPEAREKEPNNTPEQAQEVKLPLVLNGRIARAGDRDVFRFKGRRGQQVVAEVYGRRLNSPIDSLLRVIDETGRVVAWNDDHEVKEGYLHMDAGGLLTHHADSYLRVELPRDGTYYVQLSDSQRQGSGAHAYRLRLTPPHPDFALRLTPSSLSMRGGQTVPIAVHALRKDGFNGAIAVTLKDALGFELGGGRIPAGRDSVRMTLRAPQNAGKEPVALEFVGRARIGGKTITHRVVPAEDRMQAFLYRHLVPSRELRVAVTPVRWRVPVVKVNRRLPVRVPAGGSAQVRIRLGLGRVAREVKLELRDPPEGVTLGDVNVHPGGVRFRLKAKRGALPVGYADNLIVEAYREIAPRRRTGRPAREAQRVSIGFLPAIPIKIVGGRQL